MSLNKRENKLKHQRKLVANGINPVTYKSECGKIGQNTGVKFINYIKQNISINLRPKSIEARNATMRRNGNIK